MLIKRQSLFTGIIREMDLPITPKQWLKYLGGELIQDALPDLTADQREFILTGATQEEWDKAFKDD